MEPGFKPESYLYSVVPQSVEYTGTSDSVKLEDQKSVCESNLFNP